MGGRHSPDRTFIGIRLPNEVSARIDVLVKEERVTKQDYLARVIMNHLDSVEALPSAHHQEELPLKKTA